MKYDKKKIKSCVTDRQKSLIFFQRVKYSNIEIKLIDFPFRRVRANGKYIDKAIGKISLDFEKYGLRREGTGGKSKLIILD